MIKHELDEAKRLAELLASYSPGVMRHRDFDKDSKTIAEAFLHQFQELERLKECVREAASIIGSHCMEAPIGDDDTDSYCLGSSEECKEWLNKHSNLTERNKHNEKN